MQQQNFHENLTDDIVKGGPNNRSFGLTVGFILGGIGILRIYLHEITTVNLSVLAIGTLLLLGAVLAPAKLTGLNKLWMLLGSILFKCMNPIIMFVLYYIFFVPIGLTLKLFRYDPLKTKIIKTQSSYWELKTKSEIESPMKYQF